ncbi:hypothetical protein C1H46_001600 [Malus baccata]|uniref:Uncharacterized protein n=1 Tax=Malus baccata TaxID=106549 RepID=A0A540NNW4_MALBA|nr:hypothetical protein C1H46_001600 [Malus baccata]
MPETFNYQEKHFIVMETFNYRRKHLNSRQKLFEAVGSTSQCQKHSTTAGSISKVIGGCQKHSTTTGSTSTAVRSSSKRSETPHQHRKHSL